ncbi:heparan sulfate glucosamine 3-O-sulfotransferase 1-like [Amphiura filiformis]|uniref:heparan sulfate glucosamine 3-O-sulfotransferase 1-like n=1 Tax=Amphiura filiformis TaxID=82378 RepID=UPI003B20C363
MFQVVRERSCSDYTKDKCIVILLYVRRGNTNGEAKKQLKKLGCERRLPSVVIIGVKKCGTGALRYFLDLHPEVEVIGQPMNLEARDEFSVNETLRRWASRMPLTSPKQKIVAEFQYDFHAYETFFSPDKALKIIVILRDPIARALSDYLHVQDLSFGPFPLTYRNERVGENEYRTIKVYKNYELLPTFEQTITTHDGNLNTSNILITKGIYMGYIQWLVNKFGRHRVVVVDGDNFKKNPAFALKELESGLGLTPFFQEDHFQLDANGMFYCPNITERPDRKCVSDWIKTKGRKHPEIDEMVLEMLRQYYQPLNRKLQEYLNQTFTWVY